MKQQDATLMLAVKLTFLINDSKKTVWTNLPLLGADPLRDCK